MKRIIKGTEPASFTEWKAGANENWAPTYPTLQNPQKRDLHTSLLQEQDFSCCYCGREIGLDSSHIEHFRPQEHYKPLALEYNNLHASCLRETKPGNPLHCGHHKSSWFDENLHISPTEENCEQRFRYLLTGKIQSNHPEDAPAATMIEKLALDITYLTRRRQEAITGVFDEQFLTSASEAELTHLVQGLRSRDADKQLTFGHVVARYAEQLLAP
ncbi:TIGR02646 family protein [Pseudomonas syringae]|uniref:TIGR02646 family protein n=1 Tax=Pseudomonas syringae TaxID=317 RepID=A0A244EM40_PSESX|nr:retron system putative HNH endonuclease [Pseudomonas syringae]OUM05542.1 TIGR02646 family protein [Pseudomonas syringae]